MSSKPRRRLRSGFTTGTAAAAATAAALELALTGRAPATVWIPFLTEGGVEIPVQAFRALGPGGAEATVIKDAGDDPDITHGAEIGAAVCLGEAWRGAPEDSPVTITGGRGVGRVTRPGLEMPPGEAAINPGPREMIARAARAVLARAGVSRAVAVEIVVPRGDELALRTLNARLGILGGISILGTTGVVRPLSHEAYSATIRSALSVARATGLTQVVFTTGRRSERHAQRLLPDLPEVAFVQIGDFFGFALETAGAFGLAQATLAVFFGKAVKMAQGAAHTHAARSAMTLAHLAQWNREAGADPRLAAEVAAANTARQAFELIRRGHPAVIAAVGRRIREAARGFAATGMAVRVVILDFDGAVTYDSAGRLAAAPGHPT